MDAQPTPFFTGEMIFPWMFDVVPGLRSLTETANVLAEKSDWTVLYDVDRLRSNEVPVVGTIYYDDLYVDSAFAIESADLVGNCAPWITNEYEHGANGFDPTRVFDRLFSMLDEKIKPTQRQSPSTAAPG